MPKIPVPRRNDHLIARKYGTRRGFILTHWYRFLHFLGHYSSYRGIDWGLVERVVFVCKGNICRSAYAEVVARSLGMDAISCGLDTIEDVPANDAAIRSAHRRGFSLEEHRARPISRIALRKSDLLIAMEPWQTAYFRNTRLSDQPRTLLGLWAKPIHPFIQDPYGTCPEYFDNCFEYIERSVNEIAKKIKQPES
jgi:protein-tyrosine phosphatase